MTPCIVNDNGKLSKVKPYFTYAISFHHRFFVLLTHDMVNRVFLLLEIALGVTIKYIKV